MLLRMKNIKQIYSCASVHIYSKLYTITKITLSTLMVISVKRLHCDLCNKLDMKNFHKTLLLKILEIKAREVNITRRISLSLKLLAFKYAFFANFPVNRSYCHKNMYWWKLQAYLKITRFTLRLNLSFWWYYSSSSSIFLLPIINVSWANVCAFFPTSPVI